jgi:hypothetical protein
MNKKILITGAAGNIGKALLYEIIKIKYDTIILVDNNESALVSLKNELSQNDEAVNLVYIICDIKNPLSLEKIFLKHKPHIIFQLAGYTKISSAVKFPNEFFANNIKINIAVAQLSLKYNIDKVITVSNKVESCKYYFFELLNYFIELFFLQRFDKKIKYISFRVGNIINSKIYTVDNRQIFSNIFLEKYPNLKIELDCLEEIAFHLRDLGFYSENSMVCEYNSSKTITLIDYMKKNKLTNNDILIEQDYMFKDVYLENAKSYQTSHNKINIIKFNKININIERLIDGILQLESITQLNNFVFELSKLVQSNCFNYLKVIK